MFRTTSITIGEVTFESGPHLDAEYVHESIIRRHLFPSVREDNDELPPVFSSDTLSIELSDEVFDMLKSPHRGEAFSPMIYTFLKFNGNVRTMQIPHPVPYLRLAHEISENWGELQTVLQTESSRIRPKVHADGRLVTMDYGDKVKQAIEESSRLVGKSYIVHTDIASCFPSIYTHAIDWALRGRTRAKQYRSSVDNWQARLDMRFRDLQDGETNGVGIGPASSNIATEIVLQAIDRKLSAQGFEFTRYIDDYQCFVESRERAEAFLNALNEALYEYRLSLNHRKTRILNVESGDLSGWLHDVRRLSLKQSDTELDMIRKLKSLQELARKHPEESVLKYGLKALGSIVERIEPEALDKIVPEVARMVWTAPYLSAKTVKYLLPHIDYETENGAVLIDALTEVLKVGSRRRQADIVMWCLYGLAEAKYDITREDLLELTQWSPVCSALALRLFPDQVTKDFTISTRRIGSKSRELVEEQWLLRYQLWLIGSLEDEDLNTESESRYFPVLKAHGVDFFQLPDPEHEEVRTVTQ